MFPFEKSGSNVSLNLSPTCVSLIFCYHQPGRLVKGILVPLKS
jgi:hypothetical protein